jgi:hypothetical protein
MAGELKSKFTEFASYGRGQEVSSEMESKNFFKLFKDSGLVDKVLTQTDCDLIFTKVKAKGARKINYTEFVASLDQVAAKKKTTVDAISATICGSAARTNATQADYVKFHDDKTLYSGVYAQGGPSTVDSINLMAAGNLAVQMDRTSCDKRGVKITHK